MITIKKLTEKPEDEYLSSDFCVSAELYIPSDEKSEPVLTVTADLFSDFEEPNDGFTPMDFRFFIDGLSRDRLLKHGFSDPPVIYDLFEYEFTGIKKEFRANCQIVLKNEPVMSAEAIIDGKTVSIASLNDLSGEDGRREIYVETEPEFRKKGYASACVTALSERLRSEGIIAEYVTDADNTASVRVAEKAGFRMKGRRLTAVFYKSSMNGVES